MNKGGDTPVRVDLGGQPSTEFHLKDTGPHLTVLELHLGGAAFLNYWGSSRLTLAVAKYKQLLTCPIIAQLNDFVGGTNGIINMVTTNVIEGLFQTLPAVMKFVLCF